MARGLERPPWWAVVVVVGGAVWLVVGGVFALTRQAEDPISAAELARMNTAVAAAASASAAPTEAPPSEAPPSPTGVVALQDDFERRNAVTVGAAPTGQDWNESGSGGCAIADGRVVAEIDGGGNCYLSAEVDGTPTGMIVEASWTGGGALTGGITLITSTDPGWSLENMVHFNLTPAGWVLQLRTDGGNFDNVLDGDLTLATDGTVHRWGMVIAGDTVTLLLPDGATETYSSPRVAELNGPFVTVEPGSEEGVVESRVDSLQVYAA